MGYVGTVWRLIFLSMRRNRVTKKEDKMMNKVIRVGTVDCGNRKASAYCRIKFEDGKLTIVGVVGPLPSGSALGSYGQIYDDITPRYLNKYAKGWTFGKLLKFIEIWKRWHLNYMNPGTLRQMAYLRAEGKDNLGYEETLKELKKVGLNPDTYDGCKEYGKDWYFEAVPKLVIDWLERLPEADKEPAWI